MGNENSKGGAGVDGSNSRKKGRKTDSPCDVSSGEAAAKQSVSSSPTNPTVQNSTTATDTKIADGGDEENLDINASLSRQRFADSSERAVTVDDFHLLRIVGRGSFGKVFLVQKKGGIDDGATYAMKALRKDVILKRNQIEHTKTERAILATVDHPFLVGLRYAFQTKEKLYLVTDFASGGELFFWLKRERVFSQSRVKLYAAELVLAIEHLHSLDTVYRDLKPENILLDQDGHIRLTDFGLSKMEVTGAGAEGGTKTFCGTPEYLAPEILENTGHGKAVDWWSLGTLLFEMMAGLPPFYDTNTEVMYEKILSAELRFPRHFLPATCSLLAGMLTRKVEARLGYNGAAEIKSHAFFAGINWDDVYNRRVKPQFIPPPNGIAGAGEVSINTSNFEEEFTSEVPIDSVVDKSRLSSTVIEKTHFDGFTYMGEANALAGTAGLDERDLEFPDRRESYAEPANGQTQ